MKKINLVEVGMRDGLQNEAVYLSLSQRLQLAKKLAQSGLQRIEAGAFVSPQWVPQMKDSAQVMRRLQNKKELSSVLWSALVPNLRGLEDAHKAGVREIAVFGAVSETFSKKNINVSVSESLVHFKKVIDQARLYKMKVRGYISTAFACPYEGPMAPQKTISLIEKYLTLGVYEVSVGDTIGVATPKQVEQLLQKAKNKKIISHLAMHFHDTRGTALANIKTSLDFGIDTFDASLGGLGGCPYAPGAAGNVATEDVVYMLQGMGYKTGVDLQKLIATSQWMSKQLGRQLPSRLSLAGPGPY